MRRAILTAVLVPIVALVAAAQSGTLQIVPTTTLAAETGNNTSASNLFTTTTNGDIGAGNVSKVDTHTLMYPGFAGKIYAHLMGWFCMNAGSTATGGGTQCGSHIQVGYNSNDPAQVHAQVVDMMSRGFDGVIHDWYGPGDASDDIETKNYMAEAQLHPNFTFALMVDKGAIEWFSCYPGCTATQALVQITQYAANTFFSSPAYMRINGRPVITNFGIDDSYTVDWNYVAANTPGNPIFLFQNNGGFTHADTGGSYSWVMPWDLPYGDTYLSSFYATGMQYPSLYMVGAMYKGFNDTIASWSANRIMDQQCGQTWLQTFIEANSLFSSANPLDAIQLVTWDDYEEGTELETGIDNCFSVSGSVSGNILAWTISGNENTVDHYTVFISTDGQNLMALADVPAGTHQLDLSTFGIPAGAYRLYVKAVGRPSLRNQMSAAVSYTVANTTPTTGTITGTVRDSQTSAALSGATVSYSGGSTSTNSSGAYTLSNVPAGTVSLTASATGYNVSTTSVSVAGGATSTQNFSLTTLTATGTITGIVKDSVSNAALGGATVSYSGGSTTTNSSGAYTLSNVPAGTVSLTASAAGYNLSTMSVSVTTGATSTQSFSLIAALNSGPGSPSKTVTISASPTSASIARGQSGQFQLSVSESGASDPVSLSCSNLPAGMTCGFSAGTVVPTATPASVVLTVSAAQTVAVVPRFPGRHGLPMYALWMSGFGVAGLISLPEGVRRRRRAALLALVLGAAVLQLACGGGGTAQLTTKAEPTVTSASSSTYTITVSATSGTVASSTNLAVTVH